MHALINETEMTIRAPNSIYIMDSSKTNHTSAHTACQSKQQDGGLAVVNTDIEGNFFVETVKRLLPVGQAMWIGGSSMVKKTSITYDEYKGDNTGTIFPQIIHVYSSLNSKVFSQYN